MRHWKRNYNIKHCDVSSNTYHLRPKVCKKMSPDIAKISLKNRIALGLEPFQINKTSINVSDIPLSLGRNGWPSSNQWDVRKIWWKNFGNECPPLGKPPFFLVLSLSSLELRLPCFEHEKKVRSIAGLLIQNPSVVPLFLKASNCLWTDFLPWENKSSLLLCTFSLQFSRSVVSDSLQPHESQHARPACPSPTPGIHPYSRPSSQWCHPAISSSVIPFSSCPHSLPASESFPISLLCQQRSV